MDPIGVEFPESDDKSGTVQATVEELTRRLCPSP